MGFIMMTENPKCPFCGSSKTCPIFYGYPGDIEWYLDAVAKGNIIGGGCVVSGDDPTWHCHDCANEWGKKD